MVGQSPCPAWKVTTEAPCSVCGLAWRLGGPRLLRGSLGRLGGGAQLQELQPGLRPPFTADLPARCGDSRMSELPVTSRDPLQHPSSSAACVRQGPRAPGPPPQGDTAPVPHTCPPAPCVPPEPALCSAPKQEEWRPGPLLSLRTPEGSAQRAPGKVVSSQGPKQSQPGPKMGVWREMHDAGGRCSLPSHSGNPGPPARVGHTGRAPAAAPGEGALGTTKTQVSRAAVRAVKGARPCRRGPGPGPGPGSWLGCRPAREVGSSGPGWEAAALRDSPAGKPTRGHSVCLSHLVGSRRFRVWGFA